VEDIPSKASTLIFTFGDSTVLFFYFNLALKLRLIIFGNRFGNSKRKEGVKNKANYNLFFYIFKYERLQYSIEVR